MMRAAEPAGNRYFRVLDLDVEICCRDPEIGSAIDRLLHVFARPDRVESARRYEVARDATREWTVTCGAEVIAGDASWRSIAGALLVDLNHAAVDAFTGFAVHAGVVASAGAVVAFPGESGAGKSTITAACLVAGFDYVSDEALCVDVADGRVVAYPKPIALTSSGWAMIGATDRAATGIDDGEEVYVSADQLDVEVARGELRLAHVVDLVRGREPARLTERPRQESLATLLRLSFNHYKHPRTAFELASRLAATSHAWRLEYADPRPAAELLRAALG